MAIFHDARQSHAGHTQNDVEQFNRKKKIVFNFNLLIQAYTQKFVSSTHNNFAILNFVKVVN